MSWPATNRSAAAAGGRTERSALDPAERLDATADGTDALDVGSSTGDERRPLLGGRDASVLAPLGRVALWVLIALVLVRGLGAILGSNSDAERRPVAAARGESFPTAEARAFAVRFATTYLSFSPNPFRFQGFYKDQETGTYDMQARAYRPELGRFLQQDRFEDPQADLTLAADPLTSSRYAFTAGNPGTRAEYDGHCTTDSGTVVPGSPRSLPSNVAGPTPKCSTIDYDIPSATGVPDVDSALTTLMAAAKRVAQPATAQAANGGSGKPQKIPADCVQFRSHGSTGVVSVKPECGGDGFDAPDVTGIDLIGDQAKGIAENTLDSIQTVLADPSVLLHPCDGLSGGTAAYCWSQIGASIVTGGAFGITSRLGRDGRGATTDVLYGPHDVGPLADDVAATFRGGSYTERTLTTDTILYRVYGGKAGPAGRYLTRDRPTGPLQATLDSALNPEWGNTAGRVAEIRVPAGSKIYEGAAAPQPIRGGALPGGGNQIYVPRVPHSWVVRR